jgi:hypothetical protein
MPAVPVKETASGPALQQRAVAAALIVIVLLAGVLFVLLGGGGIVPTPTPTSTITPSPEATADVRRANLEIVTLRSAPNLPAPGQTFRLLIGVRNTGEIDSGPFNWTWSASPNLLNALDGQIDNVPPGATRNFSLSYSYGWWGSYDSIITIDIDGDVDESDERDNVAVSTIALSNEPFDIDFSFLPNGDIITPPLTLLGGEFEAWSLVFGLKAPNPPGCARTPISIIERDGRTVLSAEAASAAPNCVQRPMIVTLRREVSNARVEILPSADGEATFTLYSDPAGIRSIFTDTVSVVGGLPFLLEGGQASPGQIQRIEISIPGQAVNLTRLVLSSPITE